jgi:hypothetical protein
MPNPHVAIRMPSAWNPHAAVRMPPPALPRVDSMQVFLAFHHAGFTRISCEIHAVFIQVPACGFSFSDD